MKRACCRVLVAGLTVLALPAAADEIDELAARAVALETKARELESSLRPPPGPGADYAERRALDGEVLYRLKQYEQAAIVLLDVVEQYPHSPSYPEALFFLADSLYQKQDFLSAKRYFAKIVARGQGDRNYQLALQRLVELALRTGDMTSVEEQLQALAQVPQGQLLPSVPYVRGKFEFFRRRYDEAQQIFDSIPQTSEYYFQAQYIAAGSLVARQQYQQAVARFQRLLRVSARSDSDKQVQELTHLALGRLFYELGETGKAVDEYQNIGRQSSNFPEALYETAWAFIKQGELRKALRSLDLLMLARPNDPRAAEIKLLMGNLHLRLGESDEALLIYDKTHATFEPVQLKLDDLIKRRPDPKAFFHALLGQEAPQFEVRVTALPNEARTWLKQHSVVEQASRIGEDVAAIRADLDEAEQLVTRVERAILAPSRVNIFPELARARERVLEVENQMVDVRTKLASHQRQLTEGLWTPQERAEAERLVGQRGILQKALVNLPRTSDGYQERAAKARKVYEDLERRTKELWVLIESIAAQLSAIEHYYADTRATQKIPQAAFEEQANEMRGLVKALRQEYSRLRDEIASAKENIGVDDALAIEEGRMRDQIKDIVNQEKALAARVRSRLPPDKRAKVEQVQNVLDRLDAIEQRLGGFNARIDAAVNERLKQAKSILAEEKVKVAAYRQQIAEYATKSDELGGGMAILALRDARERAYNLVVEADVGVTDVAWARKDEKSQSVSRLQREQDRERRLLEEEFRQVRTSK